MNVYQNIFDGLQDGIIVVCSDLKIIELNQAALKICEISYGSAIHQPLDKIFSDNLHLIDLTVKSLTDKKPYIDTEYEFFLKKKLCHIPLSITLSPIADQNGQFKSMVISLKDISIIKELQENDHRNERLATLETITANMAHEIKNPLGGIKGAAQLLKHEIKEEGMHEYTEVIIKEVNRLNKTLESLLFVAHPKKPNFENINIHKVIGDILLLQKKTILEKNINIISSYDPSIPLIKADENQIFQVLVNLIKNAFEAMPQGGNIWITTKILIDYHMISKNIKKPSQLVMIELKDNGTGIDETVIKDIFTPFYSTKQKGSGLGLTICNNIMEAHNGKLTIINNKNTKGATATLFLPLVQK